MNRRIAVNCFKGWYVKRGPLNNSIESGRTTNSFLNLFIFPANFGTGFSIHESLL